MKHGIVGFIGAMLLLAACGNTVEEGAVQPNLNSGKADGLGVSVLSGLDYGQDVTGRFESDLQFDAYEFVARDDAKITIDVTRKGSSSKVDTTMFIFGPKEDGEYPDKAIVFDDNDGFGKLSRINDFRLFNSGTYMVVLGTEDGRGRGHYNLSLTCETGNCKPAGPGLDSCDSMVLEAAAECMNFVFNESNFDLGDEPSSAELVSDCLGTPQSSTAVDWFRFEGDVAGVCEETQMCADQLNPAQVYFAWACDRFDRPWCNDGQASFEAIMMPACREELTLPTIPDLELKEIQLDNAEILKVERSVETSCGELCFMRMQAFSFDAELPPLKEMTLMMAFEHGGTFGPGTTYHDSSSIEVLDLTFEFEVSEEMIVLVESTGLVFNEELSIGRAFWTGVPFPSVDVRDEMWVMVDEEAKVVFALEFSSASE